MDYEDHLLPFVINTDARKSLFENLTKVLSFNLINKNTMGSPVTFYDVIIKTVLLFEEELHEELFKMVSFLPFTLKKYLIKETELTEDEIKNSM